MGLRCLIVGCLLAASALAVHAQGVDIIRGRIVGPDSQPVENANVTATSVQGNVDRTARTGRDGRFTITFPNGDGDYFITISALGFSRRSFQLRRLADEEVLIADARLQRVSTVLDAVSVTAERQRPTRADPPRDITGNERAVEPADVPAGIGDLAALAATLPGIELDANGNWSALGLGADQNATLLNGMATTATGIPSDAGASMSISTAASSGAVGGFSGATLNIRLPAGNNIIRRSLALNFNSPGMQWEDATTRALGQQSARAYLSGSAAGPLVYNKAFYSAGYALGRTASENRTLVSTDPLGLRTAGVAIDSANRFLAALGNQQIPVLNGLRSDRIADNGSFAGRIDITPTSATGTSYYFMGLGGWRRQSPAGFTSITQVPAFGGDQTSWDMTLQGNHSTYYKVLLSQTTVNFSASKNYGDPYINLPAGRVRVASEFDDGTNGVQMLSFGGNQSLSTARRNVIAQVRNSLRWVSLDNRHTLNFSTELRHDDETQVSGSNLLGTFTYNSLADFDANAPASFSRQLSARRQGVRLLQGNASLTDYHRPATNLQFTYSVRADAARFLTTPASNPTLDTLFGIRNDRVPGGVYLSPRVNFSWTPGASSQVAAFAGAARIPRATVSGGINVLQGIASTTSLLGAMDNTGLPSAVVQVNCVGFATPTPDWVLYGLVPGTIPSQCAGGGTGPFAVVTPGVTAFARGFTPARSVRPTLSWRGPILGNRFFAMLLGTYSLNLNQQSALERNFTGTQRFALAEESGRPIYVQESSIVPATGALTGQDARISSRFGRVTEIRSDLRSETYQASVMLSPVSFNNNFGWSLSYTHSYGREQFRGFGGGTTVGDPLNVEWGRMTLAPHQVNYSVNYYLLNFVRLRWSGGFAAGGRFTPMIAGDVNGDGSANDRAYVFDPATATDPTVVAGIQSLLENGSRPVRECLSRQLGRLAQRNSCARPWMATNSFMTFELNPLKVRLPQRAILSFQLSNPLGAADLLLHGTGNLRGWGTNAFPDNALLHVRGFEPAAGATPARFRYEVNRRFGSTSPALNAGFRTPVTLTAALRFDVGPARERQVLMRNLDRGRRYDGDKFDVNMVRGTVGNGGIPQPLGMILLQQDSLRLTARQADSIATMNRAYVLKVQQIWAPIAREFAALPNDYDRGATYHRYVHARRQTADLLRGIVPFVRNLLTDEQYRKLPPLIAAYLDPRYIEAIRSSTAGSAAMALPLPVPIIR